MLTGGRGGLRGARRGRHRVAADSSAAHSELPSGANERVFQLSRKSKRFYAGNFGSRGPSGICGVGRMRKRGRIPDGLPARSPYVGSEVRRPLKLSDGARQLAGWVGPAQSRDARRVSLGPQSQNHHRPSGWEVPSSGSK